MSKNTLLVAMLLASSASAASTCEELRTQIEAKIRANGVAAFSVSVVEAGASAPGSVVGTAIAARGRSSTSSTALQAPARQATPRRTGRTHRRSANQCRYSPSAPTER